MKRYLIAVVCLVLLAACGGKTPVRPYLSASASDAEKCRDLTRFPQDLHVYAQKAGADKRLLSAEEQAQHDAKADTWFFAPWHLKKTSLKRQDALWALYSLKPENAFAENLRPFPLAYWEELKANCNAQAYPSRQEYGITVRNSAMRGMPTHRPFFRNPDEAGEGFPFDYFQTTAVWAGTPVLITHVSTDGEWVMAETRLTAGWMPAADVAMADEEFRALWESRPLAVVIKDNTRLGEGAKPDAVTGRPQAVTLHIGTILPLAGHQEDKDPTGIRVLFPMRGESGRAEWQERRLEAGQAAEKPLPLTPGNMARVGNSMMGQPYGWGGLFENRDCSALTRDLFLVFGIWLPRNSGSQGRWGTPIELEGLSPDQKEAVIKAEAPPFMCLLWLKGHIALYLGTYENTPVMFHNMWGLRTVEPANAAGEKAPKDGRAVIGKAVVTSLRPGAELPTIATPASLLDRMVKVSVMPEAENKTPVKKSKK